jgi:hypothetical protein
MLSPNTALFFIRTQHGFIIIRVLCLLIPIFTAADLHEPMRRQGAGHVEPQGRFAQARQGAPQ